MIDTDEATLTIELTRTGNGPRAWEAYAPDHHRTGYGIQPGDAVADLMSLLRGIPANLAAWQRAGMGLTRAGQAQVATLTALFGSTDGQ